MRTLLFILIALGLGLGVYYFMLSENGAMQQNVNEAQNQAQQAADDYRKTQAEMMLQLEQ